jgi:hypothetical protein
VLRKPEGGHQVNLKVVLFLIAAALCGVAAHYLFPAEVSTRLAPSPPPPISFFTWDSRPRGNPPSVERQPLPAEGAQVESLDAPAASPAPAELTLPADAAPLLHAHDCHQVARRAGAIFNIFFVGIPFRPPEETLERHLLQEVAHSHFSSRDQAVQFVLQLCSADPYSVLPLWPHLPPDALRDEVAITNEDIR